MGRYKKYLEIIDCCDRCLENQGMKLLDGKVTTADLEKVEKVLCIMHKAWQVAWEVDRLDDIEKAMNQISKQSEKSGQSKTTAMGGNAQTGNDFHSESGYSDTQAASGGYYPNYPGQEEDRRGRRRTYRTRSETDEMTLAELVSEGDTAEEARRRRRRYRALLDAMDAMELAETNASPGAGAAMSHGERDFWGIPFMWPYAKRMGYTQPAHSPEQNAPYNNGGNLPAGNNANGNMTTGTHMPTHTEPAQAGIVHAPVQTANNNGAAVNQGASR